MGIAFAVVRLEFDHFDVDLRNEVEAIVLGPEPLGPGAVAGEREAGGHWAGDAAASGWQGGFEARLEPVTWPVTWPRGGRQDPPLGVQRGGIFF